MLRYFSIDIPKRPLPFPWPRACSNEKLSLVPRDSNRRSLSRQDVMKQEESLSRLRFPWIKPRNLPTQHQWIGIYQLDSLLKDLSILWLGFGMWKHRENGYFGRNSSRWCCCVCWCIRTRLDAARTKQPKEKTKIGPTLIINLQLWRTVSIVFILTLNIEIRH